MIGFDILSLISCGRCGSKICRVSCCRATRSIVCVSRCRGVLNDKFLAELLGAVIDEIVPLLIGEFFRLLYHTKTYVSDQMVVLANDQLSI